MTYKTFAYGSNMSTTQMKARCPKGVRVVGIARLDGYELIFPRTSSKDDRRCADGSPGGVSSIRKTTNGDGYIEGVIFEIDDTDVAALDRAEGISSNSYVKEQWQIPVSDGTTHDCWVYLANSTGDFTPSQTYKSIILNGAEEHKLSDEYKDKLKQIQAG
jgi:cation transport regulator ChaC